MTRLFAVLVCLLLAPIVRAQEPEYQMAPVKIDGTALFQVRGVEARPAVERAAGIIARIEALAADRSFRPEALRVEERGDATYIVGGPLVVMGLGDADGNREGVPRALLAPVYMERIRSAIDEYRDARTGARLAVSTGRAVIAVTIAALIVVLIVWVLRRGEGLIQRAFDQRVAGMAAGSRRILPVERLRETLHAVLGLVRAAAILLVALFVLQYVLVQFPWTRDVGLRLFDFIATPLVAVAQGVLATIPNLVLLAILYFITRYGLSLARVYFESVRDGTIEVRNFEPEWAHPTYNLVRVVVIALALVIAYPLIPGSNSNAFKGLSILAGVMLSLGSTSAMANVVAGYLIIYRRSFRVGDRVKIGEIIGIVTDLRLQVTHIRTSKNEEITIPNANILTSEVTNYSRPAREGSLILHSEVGVGYGVPWRQVEAMLIAAARRTAGLLNEPPPFVLPKRLGDFAVTYEINGYSDRTQGIPYIYADLHRNILDQFNEQGVQIMTPAYEGDPETPKIVAKDQWFAAPATNQAASPVESRSSDASPSAALRS